MSSDNRWKNLYVPKYNLSIERSLKPTNVAQQQKLVEQIIAATNEVCGNGNNQQNAQSSASACPVIPSTNRYAAHSAVIRQMSKTVSKTTADMLRERYRSNGNPTISFSVHVMPDHILIHHIKAYKHDYWSENGGTAKVLYSSFGMGNVSDTESLFSALLVFLNVDFREAVQTAFRDLPRMKISASATRGKCDNQWNSLLWQKTYAELKFSYQVLPDTTLKAW